MMNVSYERDMFNKSQRLVLGLLVLILVDVIWVSCTQLKKYILQHDQFDKPFFVTYVKTSFFTVYLLAVCLWPSWRDNFRRTADYSYITEEVDDDDDAYLRGSFDSKLSSPSYVPIKFGSKSSGTESDDSTISRSVRFKKVAEVRQMSQEEATEALLARLSYTATLRISKAIPFTPSNKLTVFQTAWLSLPFCFLWFISNYTMHVASLKSKFSNQAVFSASAATFVMTLSAMFPVRACDKFTFTKFVVVLVTVCSLCFIAFSDPAFSSFEWRTRSSVLLTVFSSFLFSLYVVFLMNNADHEEKLDIPLLCGFTGLFCLTILWPGFFLLHFINWEVFEWPNLYQWTFLLADGLLGTMLSQVLWLWGCFLTSSLLATVAISMTVPLCILMDAFIFDVKHTSLLYAGLIPIFVFFSILVILTYLPNSDPIVDLFGKLWGLLCRNKSFRMTDYDLEQSESLINVNETDSHEA